MAQTQTQQSTNKSNAAPKLNKVQDFEEKGNEFAGQAKEAVSSFVEQGSETVRGWMSDAGEMLSDAEGSVRNNIKKYPLQAVLIGLGIGCAAGLLWNLSRKA